MRGDCWRGGTISEGGAVVGEAVLLERWRGGGC